MRTIIIALLFIFISNSVSAQLLNPVCDWTAVSWPSIAKCDTFESGDWVMVFNDEFDGNQIDRSKWYTCIGGWNREHGDELQYYLDENIVLQNGILKLTSKREPGYYDVWRWDENGNGYITPKYFEFTSGYIESKMQFEYGFYEIRCKIPYGKGFWPAFWLFGGEGEIDVFEFAGDEPNDHSITLHKWPQNGGHDMCSTTKNYGTNFSSGFHTFSAEWDEFKIVYRVDGDIKRIDYKFFILATSVGLYDCQHHVPTTYARNNLFPLKPESVIMNLAISCDDCPFGGPPNASTIFPSALEIDYIRIYRRKNPTRNISKCNFDANESSAITGKTITLGGSGCDFVIENDKSLFLVADESITMLPGFWAKNGSKYLATTTVRESCPGSASTLMEVDNIASSNIWNKPITIMEGDYQIFPNPTNGQFTIENYDEINLIQKIEIIDLNGRLIYQYNEISKSVLVDLSNQSKGIYMIRIYKKDTVFVNKVIYQ